MLHRSKTARSNKITDAWKGFVAITSSSMVEEGWNLPSTKSPTTVLRIQKLLEALYPSDD